MIKNLFSSKDKSSDLTDEIKKYLQDHKSTTFPDGLLHSVLDFDVKKESRHYVVSMCLPFPCQGELENLLAEMVDALDIDLELSLSLKVNPVRQHQVKGIKNIIAIASGKGGVGKSTTSVNLAYALMAEGASVGILDADIYGPSLPTMLNLKGQRPTSKDGKLMQPLTAEGLSAMSIGFLMGEDDATVWRGPMASTAFTQMLNETDWPDLDYLIVDMPPGTGDIQLTLAQKIPVAGACIVTTPQDIALDDAKKGITMFDKVQVPVLGVVENMSYHICDNCGHQSHLFGVGGANRISEQFNVPVLGQLPLNLSIREDGDTGTNCVLQNATGELAQFYRNIARSMAATLYYQLDANSPYTPNIIIKEE
ncbi:iron-sulfur cluster carrier protein ApbC [Thalassotalea aquiviva]|uniref:iron-sulfur cluster carrier protein ApbC n=1 Tax=Thalassotalea aquiviva TaxID=3242415 RepID=UPI00352BA878